MGTQEIYKQIANKLLQGVMIHQEFITYYHFLGLQGYKTCQYYHYLEQVCRYQDFLCFYMEHTNKIIPKHFTNNLSSTSIVPDNWYEYERFDVDSETKKNAVKSGFQKWLVWERDIKKFLQESYLELTNSTQIAFASKLQEYICDVTEQIKIIQNKYLNLKAINYDLTVIVEEQDDIKQKYEKKLKFKNTEKGKGQSYVKSSRD